MDNIPIDLIILFNIILIAIAVFTLIYSVISGKAQINKLSEQLNLLRKHVFGEIYPKPQFESAQFFTPSKDLYEVRYLPQENKTTYLGKEIKIKTGQKIELPIITKSKKIQRVKRISIGFKGTRGEKPEIINMGRLGSKTIHRLPREEYIDIWGQRYIEYMHPKTFPEGEDFIITLFVRGNNIGKYQLRLVIYTEESQKPLIEGLYVEVTE